MGDRGNIIVQDSRFGDNKVYLYTHWYGHCLPTILQDALRRGKNRWEDAPYLARIIFSEMIKDHLMNETGFGISSRYGDGGVDITVDITTRIVSIEGNKHKSYSFDEYSNLKDPSEILKNPEEDEEDL